MKWIIRGWPRSAVGPEQMPLKSAVVPVMLLDSLILMPKVEQMLANRDS